MFKEELQKNLFLTNTKGGLYFDTTYNFNLDIFSMASRFMDEDILTNLFNYAYDEDKYLLTANILYLLDIRNGKGERRIFKILFKNLCLKDQDLAKKVLNLIPNLGRYDYILETYDTPLWINTLEIIKNQLKLDEISLYPSLLAKWLPSIRNHNKNNAMARILCKELNISEKNYRKMLKDIRLKLNIIEIKLSNKDYDINYEIVPSKAMKLYNNTFNRHDDKNYKAYLDKVNKGEAKINTASLEPYDIIKQILSNADSKDLMNLMWENQKDIFSGNYSNVLVIADTSGSMFTSSMIPISSALGLAIYAAQNNKGQFHNMFMNFSSETSLQEIHGSKLSDILKSINFSNWGMSTDIDKALKIILNASIKSPSDCPSHLLIISDMEFDLSVDKQPNFYHWKEQYQKNNLKMPNVIFWNVSENSRGIPVTKYENGVALVSGFSKNVFKSILNLESYSPIKIMEDTLKPYLEMLK